MKRLFHHCNIMITLFLLILMSLSLSLSPDIKNAYIPACIHCIHHKIENNECTKFGFKDIVTNKVAYEAARACRADESKCGFNGLYFERNTSKLKMVTVRFNDIISNPLTIWYLNVVRTAIIYVLTIATLYYFFYHIHIPNI